MLLAFFSNAAIDQQCELYIKEHGLEKDVQNKIDKIYSGKVRPEYEGELPKGHNGLGLMLGVSGDQVLDKKVYEELKKKTLAGIRGTVQADILKEDQAQKILVFFQLNSPSNDGRFKNSSLITPLKTFIQFLFRATIY